MLVMLNISILYSLLFSISRSVSSVARLLLDRNLYCLQSICWLRETQWQSNEVRGDVYQKILLCGYPKVHVSNLPHKKVLWRLFNAPEVQIPPVHSGLLALWTVAQHWPVRRREQWSRQYNMVAHLYCIPVDWLQTAVETQTNSNLKEPLRSWKTFPGTKSSAGFDETWLTEWISSLQLSHLSSSMCSVRETPSWPEFSLYTIQYRM